jgi:hypothetical protein
MPKTFIDCKENTNFYVVYPWTVRKNSAAGHFGRYPNRQFKEEPLARNRLKKLGTIMKEYKLAAWPDLPATFHRTSFRRMLSDMSHRYVTVQQLMTSSGGTRMEVRLFLQMLAERGLLRERDVHGAEESRFAALLPLGGWLRRAMGTDEDRQ